MSTEKKIANVRTRQQANTIAWANAGVLFTMQFILWLFSIALSWVGEIILNGVLREELYVIAYPVSLIPTLLMVPLSLGQTATILNLARGQVVSTMGLFSRLSYWLKAIGQQINYVLRLLLWALPGFLFMVLMIVYQNRYVFDYGIVNIHAILMIETGISIAFIVMAVLMLIGAMGYALSTQLLADDPSTGILESFRLSKCMMKFRKWQYVKLGMPYLLKGAAVSLVYGIVLTVLRNGLGVNTSGPLFDVVGWLVQLLVAWLMLPMPVASALFYLDRRAEFAPDTDDQTTSY